MGLIAAMFVVKFSLIQQQVKVRNYRLFLDVIYCNFIYASTDCHFYEWEFFKDISKFLNYPPLPIRSYNELTNEFDGRYYVRLLLFPKNKIE